MKRKELTESFMMISNWKKNPFLWLIQKYSSFILFYIFIFYFKPEFTIIIFTHYKLRIAVAILEL